MHPLGRLLNVRLLERRRPTPAMITPLPEYVSKLRSKCHTRSVIFRAPGDISVRARAMRHPCGAFRFVARAEHSVFGYQGTSHQELVTPIAATPRRMIYHTFNSSWWSPFGTPPILETRHRHAVLCRHARSTYVVARRV